MGKVEMRNKTIKLDFGDRINVRMAHSHDEVIMEMAADGDDWVFLTPKQARQVAKALRKAARKAEATSALSRVERSFQ